MLNFEDDSYKVEWKSLGEVCEIIRGNGLQKKDFVEEGVPCIHYGQIYTYYGMSTNSTKSFVDKYTAEKLKKATSGDIIVATTSENIADVGKTLVWEGEQEVCFGGHSCVLRTQQNSRYLSYFMSSSSFQKQKEKQVVGTKVIELYPKNLAKISIPVPPLSIQEKIVHVLDNFDTVCNDLNIGLPKEIELRQKQYEYFRDQLLTYTAEGVYTDSTVQYRQDLIRLLWYVFGPIKVELGSIAGYSTDKIFNKELTSDTYVGVDNLLQNKLGKKNAVYIPDSGKSTIYLKEDILIGNIRPYLKKIWFATNSGGSSGDVLTVQNHIKDILMSRYLYYLLSGDDFFHFDMQFAKGAKMPRGNKKSIMTYKITLPPLSIQEKIVQTLDKFDTLTSDLSQGLPKEIALRQKQYEYFRDQLLKFKS